MLNPSPNFTAYNLRPIEYEKIQADIYSRQKGHGPYDRVYTRNDIMLSLIEQLQTDIVELKQNQA
jgi:hypothetical protein